MADPPNESTRLLEKKNPQSKIIAFLKSQNAIIFCYCVALLISAVCNSIFFKKMTNKMPNYVYFLSQVTTVVYVPFFGAIVVYELLYTNFITKEMTAIPKSKFFVMGAFDSLAGIFMLFGGVHTSGSRQALLLNSVIPVTMLLSYVVLGTRFRKLQIAGAATILSGVMVTLLPQFLSSKVSSVDQPLFNMLFLASTLPQAFSSIYKEFLFHKMDIDVNYMQAWIAIWQVVFGLMLIPLNTLSFLGPQALTWSELPSALVNGGKCMFGINTVVPPHCTAPVTSAFSLLNTTTSGLSMIATSGGRYHGGIPCDDCTGAWIPVMLYLFFNCNYNIFIMLVIKHGNAALMYIIMTLRLPLVQLAFAIPMVNNPPDSFSLTSMIGLAVILLGLVCYRWPTQEPKLEEGEEEVAVTFIGTQTFPSTIRRRVMQHIKSATQIRSSLYSKLGVIQSPVTPYSPRSRGTPGGGRSSGTTVVNMSRPSPRTGLARGPVKASKRSPAIPPKSQTTSGPSQLPVLQEQEIAPAQSDQIGENDTRLQRPRTRSQ